MSRFIPEGKGDLGAQHAREVTASSKYQEEEENRETLSLYEQMRLNHMEKEREYQEKVKAQNQPYKIDEREQRFYDDLKEREALKAESKKRELEEGMGKFEKMKKLKTKSEEATLVPPTLDPITIPIPKIVKRKVIRKSAPSPKAPNKATNDSAPPPLAQPDKKPVLTGYSSSESDSD